MDNLICAVLNVKSSGEQTQAHRMNISSRFHFNGNPFGSWLFSLLLFLRLSASLFPHCRLKNDNADCIDYVQEPNKMEKTRENEKKGQRLKKWTTLKFK